MSSPWSVRGRCVSASQTRVPRQGVPYFCPERKAFVSDHVFDPNHVSHTLEISDRQRFVLRPDKTFFTIISA